MLGFKIFAADDMIFRSTKSSRYASTIDDSLYEVTSSPQATTFVIGHEAYSYSSQILITSETNPDFSTTIVVDRFGNAYLEESYEGDKEHHRIIAEQAKNDYALIMKEYYIRFKKEALTGESYCDFIDRIERQERKVCKYDMDADMADGLSKGLSSKATSLDDTLNINQVSDNSTIPNKIHCFHNIAGDIQSSISTENEQHVQQSITMVQGHTTFPSFKSSICSDDFAWTTLVPAEKITMQAISPETSFDLLAALNMEKENHIYSSGNGLDSPSPLPTSMTSSPWVTFFRHTRKNKGNPASSPATSIKIPVARQSIPERPSNNHAQPLAEFRAEEQSLFTNGTLDDQTPVIVSLPSKPCPDTSDSGYGSESETASANDGAMGLPTLPDTPESLLSQNHHLAAENQQQTEIIEMLRAQISKNQEESDTRLAQVEAEKYRLSAQAIKDQNKHTSKIAQISAENKKLRRKVAARGERIRKLGASQRKFKITAGYIGEIGVTNEMYQQHLDFQNESWEEQCKQEVEATVEAGKKKLAEQELLHNSIEQQNRRNLLEERRRHLQETHRLREENKNLQRDKCRFEEEGVSRANTLAQRNEQIQELHRKLESLFQLWRQANQKVLDRDDALEQRGTRCRDLQEQLNTARQVWHQVSERQVVELQRFEAAYEWYKSELEIFAAFCRSLHTGQPPGLGSVPLPVCGW